MGLFFFSLIFFCVCVWWRWFIYDLNFHSSRQSAWTTRRTNSLDLEHKIKTRESIKKKIILHHSCIPFCPGFRNQRLFHLPNKTQSLTCTRSLYNRSAISAKDSEKSCLFCFFLHTKEKWKSKFQLQLPCFFVFYLVAIQRPIGPSHQSKVQSISCLFVFCLFVHWRKESKNLIGSRLNIL